VLVAIVAFEGMRGTIVGRGIARGNPVHGRR
jgi:hypothetical protein